MRKKKKSKFKILIFIFIVYTSFIYTFYSSFKNKKYITNEEFINMLITYGNTNFLSDNKVPNIINTLTISLFKINLKKPTTILNSTILGTAKKEVKINYEEDDYSNMQELTSVSSHIEDKTNTLDNPIIYIYNSHQLEEYDNSNVSIYGITPNVLMASLLLKDSLTKKEIPSIVEDANMTEILNNNSWNYAMSYKASRTLMDNAKVKYPTLKYFIDIHRDSISKNASTININGLSYAKVLFIVGLDHDTWKDNMDFATKLDNIISKNYPNLSRGIMQKTGAGVNGIYNQDFNANTILIEVGGNQNNSDEVYNTMNAIADTLAIYLKEQS